MRRLLILSLASGLLLVAGSASAQHAGRSSSISSPPARVTTPSPHSGRITPTTNRGHSRWRGSTARPFQIRVQPVNPMRFYTNFMTAWTRASTQAMTSWYKLWMRPFSARPGSSYAHTGRTTTTTTGGGTSAHAGR